MRITTWNVNGMRAALRKGFAEVVDAIAPDVLLLQEIRCTPDQLPDTWATPDGWHATWHPAQRKGYAGTAVWTRDSHRVLERGLNHDANEQDPDDEGRVMRVRVAGVHVTSVYLPSGSASAEGQAKKEAWMARFRSWCDARRKLRAPVVIGGDLNVAHAERDLYYAKSNAKQSGFMPHERAWIGDLFDAGWRDTHRHHFGDVEGPYTWWSNRGQARALDRGWRIDYLLANPAAAKRVTDCHVHRELALAVSDHAPASIDLN